MSDAVSRGELDLVVFGGTVVTARGRHRANLCIADGRVVEWSYGEPPRARRMIDATGRLVLPGMIDCHVHLMDPGEPEREDFLHGTAAAAAAGVTTILEHTHAWPVTSVERLRTKLEHLENRSHVDFGLVAHAWPGAHGDLEPLWHAGIAMFKIFTCTTHGIQGHDADALFQTLSELARLDAPSLMHCEDEVLTRRAEERLRLAGRQDPGLLVEWRSREAELIAVTQAALTARLTGARVMIAHASSQEVVAALGDRDLRAPNVRVESCPQYLLLDEQEVFAQGAARKFTPPARRRSESDEAEMWRLFNAGLIDQIDSDHAPSTLAQKSAGTFWDAPFGLPGLDTTYPVMVDAALRGRTSLERVIAACSEGPARWLHLSGKGGLHPGNDADLVIIDPEGRRHIDRGEIRSKAGWSPYEGRELLGRAMMTLVRGQTVFEGGTVNAPSGRFIPGPGLLPTGA